MPTIRFVLPDGQMQALPAEIGMSLMEVARAAGLKGILGDCGGECQCATCHVYIDENHISIVPPAEEMERDMLEGVAAPLEPGSRLSCQVIVSRQCDDMIVRLPECQ